MKTYTTLLASLCMVAAMSLIGCGGPSAPAPTETTEGGVRTINITGNDQMQYNIHEIKAKQGEKLRVQMKNIGRMPAQAMSHNWVLLKKMDAAGVNAFAMAAASKTPDHIPDDQSAILFHTKMLGPQESDTIIVTAPMEAGSYPYLCSFPGHAALMKGQFIVE